VEVALRLQPLHHRASFEIRGFCEVQNRGARPWLDPVLIAGKKSTQTGGGLELYNLVKNEVVWYEM